MSLNIFSSWNLQSTAIAVLIASLFSPQSNAQSIEYVVFSIKGTTDLHKIGQVLKEGDPIELSPDVEINLLSKTGEFTRLEGPFMGFVTNESNDERGELALTKLASLLFEEEKVVPIVGATRSLNTQAELSDMFSNPHTINPWIPVLSQYDNYCLNRDQPVLLRSSDDTDITVTMTTATSENIEISWPAGSHSLHLKDYIDPGHTTMSLFLGDQLAPITIHILDIDNTTFIEQAAWMAEQNCQYQALQHLTKGE